MKRARSLLTGNLVNAKSTTKYRAKYHKLVCPECFEPVALVRKNKQNYFAHCPFKETSPYCLWRIIRDSGKPVVIKKPPPLVRPILLPDVFQKVLRITFGVASLRPLTLPYQRSAKRLEKMMHSVWSKRRQCVNISDFLTPTEEYIRKWTSAGRQIRIYEAERAKNFSYLASKFKLPKAPKKAAALRKRRVSTILLLWSQLHEAEFENELHYLLQLAYHIYKGSMPRVTSRTRNPSKYTKSIITHFIQNMLNILTAVPWDYIIPLINQTSKKQCTDCGQELLQVSGIKVRKCRVCGKSYCLTCGKKTKYICKKCFEVLCSGCAASHTCPRNPVHYP